MMNRKTEDKKWGMITHLAAFSAILLPIGLVLGPLIVWFLKRDDSRFLYKQGRNAINFQLTILSISFVIVIFSTLFRPLVIIAVLVGISGLVFAGIAAMKAKQHISYQYPFSIKLIK